MVRHPLLLTLVLLALLMGQLQRVVVLDPCDRAAVLSAEIAAGNGQILLSAGRSDDGVALWPGLGDADDGLAAAARETGQATVFAALAQPYAASTVAPFPENYWATAPPQET